MAQIKVHTPKREPNGSVTLLGISVALMHEADFVLDLLTFKVHKHRYGDRMMTPQQAHEWLTFYLEQPNMRILLLTD